MADILEIKVACWSNLSLCYLRLERWEKALMQAEHVLEVEPGHLKALVRSAEALLELRDWDSSLERLELVLSVDPDNSTALRLRKRVKKALKQHDQITARRLQRAFNQMSLMQEEEEEG